jgi:hypothetical protein
MKPLDSMDIVTFIIGYQKLWNNTTATLKIAGEKKEPLAPLTDDGNPLKLICTSLVVQYHLKTSMNKKTIRTLLYIRYILIMSLLHLQISRPTQRCTTLSLTRGPTHLFYKFPAAILNTTSI